MTLWSPALQELMIGSLALLCLGLGHVAMKRREKAIKDLDSRLASRGLLNASVFSYMAANEEIARSLRQIEDDGFTSIITAADARPGDRWDITIH